MTIMKFLNEGKGKFKYINRRRVFEIIKTVVFFAFAIGLYLLGYLTLKTNKSLWSVFAVLSVLPAAKSAVSMIMFIRFSSIPEEEYTCISEAAGDVNTIYELVFTTRERAYFVKALSCAGNTIVGLYEGTGDKNPEVSAKEIREHIDATLKRNNVNGCSIKLYTDIKGYTDRLREMDRKLKTDESYVQVFGIVRAITM